MKREPIGYPPGFFLELVRAHDWPPGFVPEVIVQPRVDMHAVSVRSRATALANGYTGTIKGLSGRTRLIVGDASKASVSLHQVITCDQAKGAGLKRYFTGKPCFASHLSQRYVSSHACVECMSASSRAQYAAQKKAVAA